MKLFHFVWDLFMDELVRRGSQDAQGDSNGGDCEGDEEERCGYGEEGHLFGEGDDQSDVEKSELIESWRDIGNFL